MILIDANLLLYAYHPKAAQHEPSRAWLEGCLTGSQLVRLTWLTVWAFLRISTNPRVFEFPFSIQEAEGIVTTWLEHPLIGILEPGDQHWMILQTCMKEGQTHGPLVMDAVLAAIALEHGAVLYTTDQDFSRFPKLKWINPLQDHT
ncbi:MAG: ribonuclease VapC37 [Nitrospirales bacterium]|nr:MAG: ribonuclease VapC37 [Nitrospirales bacterium]